MAGHHNPFLISNWLCLFLAGGRVVLKEKSRSQLIQLNVKGRWEQCSGFLVSKIQELQEICIRNIRDKGKNIGDTKRGIGTFTDIKVVSFTK